MTSPVTNEKNFYASQLINPVSASVSLVPVFYGFVVKSALQRDVKPEITPRDFVKGVSSSAPLVAAQVVAQNAIEYCFNKQFAKNGEKGFHLSLASALLVGVATAPTMTILNGWTMNTHWKDSLYALSKSPKIVSVIVARETAFLFGLRMSAPLSDSMKTQFGENKAVEYSTVFANGFICGAVSHPADTAFTRWQKQMTITKVADLSKGGFVRSLTIGGFFLSNHIVSEYLKSKL